MFDNATDGPRPALLADIEPEDFDRGIYTHRAHRGPTGVEGIKAKMSPNPCQPAPISTGPSQCALPDVFKPVFIPALRPELSGERDIVTLDVPVM